MNVAYNRLIIKIANGDIPPTLDEFTTKTLPENFERRHLPSNYSLCYLDRGNLPITVLNQRNYQTMCQVMGGMNAREEDLRLVIVPEDIIKVEEGADGLPIRNVNHVGPVVDAARQNQNPQINEELAPNNLEADGNNQEAHRPPIQDPNAVEEEVPLQVNENPQSTAEPIQENPMNIENGQEIPSRPIYTHHNVDWIVNEVNEAAIKKRKRGSKKRSKRSKENKGSQEIKRSKGNERSKLQKEVQSLEKSKTQREVWKSLEDVLENEMRPPQAATLGATQEQSLLLNESNDSNYENLINDEVSANSKRIGRMIFFLRLTRKQVS